MLRGLAAVVTVAALAFGVAVEAGQAPDLGDLEERVRRLEEEIEKLRDEMLREDPQFDNFGLRLKEMLRDMDAWTPRSARPAEGRAFLGVSLSEIDRMEGALVQEVVPGSAADAAGIKTGDVVTEFGGRQIRVVRDLVDFVGERRPGESVEMKVLRGDRLIQMKVVLGEADMSRMPQQRGPRMRGFPDVFGGARRPPTTMPDAALPAGQKITVEVETEEGRVEVSVSVPGLFITDELARELRLSARQRGRVETAFAEARDEFAERLAAALREGDAEGFDAAFMARLRAEAETAAREKLAGALSGEQLARLQAAQTRMGARSEYSISRSHGRAEESRRPPVARPAPDAPAEGGLRDF